MYKYIKRIPDAVSMLIQIQYRGIFVCEVMSCEIRPAQNFQFLFLQITYN